jgi:transcriptional regulator with XRE-family HTH domain
MNKFADSPPPLTGAELCLLRMRKGVKAKQVAATLGMSPSYYSEIERGKKAVPSSSEFLRSWIAAVGLTLEEVQAGKLENPKAKEKRGPESSDNWKALAESLMQGMPDEEVLGLIRKWLGEYEQSAEELDPLFRCKHALEILLRRRLIPDYQKKKL